MGGRRVAARASALIQTSVFRSASLQEEALSLAD